MIKFNNITFDLFIKVINYYINVQQMHLRPDWV